MNIKRMLPFIIFNAIIFSIIGGFIGKNLVTINNTRKRIDNDSETIKKFLKDIAKTCPNQMSMDEFEKMGNDDPKKPIEPTVIYIYN